jgi:hypothetical protein
MGILGTSADILIDVNLILQYVVLAILLIGVFYRKRSKQHGRLMFLATLFNMITVLVIMGPALFTNPTTYPLTIYAHAFIGIIAIFLGLLFSYRFWSALSEGKPFLCGSKRVMIFAILMWIGPIIGGTIFYIQQYVPMT